MLGDLTQVPAGELADVVRLILERVRRQGELSAFDETELLQVAREIDSREECARLARDNYAN